MVETKSIYRKCDAMKVVKCPRCELNYMLSTESMCDVCKKERKMKDEPQETLDICPACGERPVVPGEEFCKICLRERKRIEQAEAFDDEDEKDAAAEETEELEPDMEDEAEVLEAFVDVDTDEEIPESELSNIDRELAMEEEEEDGDFFDEEEEVE